MFIQVNINKPIFMINLTNRSSFSVASEEFRDQGTVANFFFIFNWSP